MNGPRILCVGMATIDHVFRLPAIPREPTKVRATEYVRISGGMAANAAVAAARLGARVEFWGPVGDDATGNDILPELAAEGGGGSGAGWPWDRMPGGSQKAMRVRVDSKPSCTERNSRRLVDFGPSASATEPASVGL